MANPKVAPLALGILFACSCASAPPEPAAPPPEPKPKVAVKKEVKEVAEAPLVVLPTKPRKKLGPGQCEDCFDCVDTVGFPPPGYRWNCVNGKCGRAKLPSVGPTGAATGGDTPAASEEPPPAPAKAKKKKKRRRR